MSKKNKKKNAKAQKVLGSFKDLGMLSRDTLSRLGTTVKADAPTVLLNAKDALRGTVRSAGISVPFNAGSADGAPTSRIGQIAQKFIPFRRPGMRPAAPAEARKKVQIIARQMGQKAMMKDRSRLPLVIALVAVIFAAGGWYAWSSVDLPDVNITQYMDYNNWLKTTAGEVKRSDTLNRESLTRLGSQRPETPSVQRSYTPARKPAATAWKVSSYGKNSVKKTTASTKTSKSYASKKAQAQYKKSAAKKYSKTTVKSQRAAGKNSRYYRNASYRK